MKHKHLLLSLTLGLSGVLLIIVAMLLRPPTPSLGHPLDENEAAVAHAVASRAADNVATPAPDILPAPEASTPYNRVAAVPIPGAEHPHFSMDKPAVNFPLAPPLGSDADFVVSLDSDRVWGLVGAGETVTVMVNGAQMGAALANNLGFFWTTLYDANGDRPYLSGGETVSIYHDGTLAASTMLRSIAGQVDPLNDDVNGVIGGADFPLEVTVYTGQTGEPTLISYGQSTNTDDIGNFTVDFTGNWDYFADEYVIVAYTEGGVEVHRYARAQRLVVQPFPIMGVTGFSTPGAAVTVTVYTADGVTVREQLSDITDPETGRYRFSPGMETADIVVLEVEGGLVMSRTVETFEFTVDAQNDHMVGLTTPGAMLLGRASDLTANGDTAVLVHGVADASGVFTLDFSASADLMPGQWVGAYIADAEGDDLNLWAPVQGFVDVNQTWNEVSGWAVTPPGSLGEGHPLTLTVYHAADDNVSVYTKGSGWHGGYTFNQDDGLPDIEPGDVITVESEGYAWQGVVHVQTMTVAVDLENDRFTGAVTAPTERVELWGRLGSSEPYQYPLAGEFTMLVTATSPFTGVPAGFDVDYDIEYEVRHRTAGDNLERINGVTDGFGAWLPGNFMWAAITPPETPYTLTVYDNVGTIKAQTTGVSHSPVGSTDGFDVQATGQTIQPGDSIQAQSATGFSQTVLVLALSANAVLGDDLVTGHGPANTLLHFGVFRGDNRFAEGFVPTDADGAYAFRVNQLQVVADDGNLRPRDIIQIAHLTPQQAWIIDRYEIPFAEVGVSKWNPGGFARPGGKVVYGISYWNSGSATAADTVIADTLPLSTTYAGDTSGLPVDIGADGVITWHVGDVLASGNSVFAVTLDIAADVLTGTEVITHNCATIATLTPGDDYPDNDVACSDPVDVWDSDVGINVDKWPNPGDPTPGQEFEYTIRWCTDYGANFGPVWLTDTLPVSTTLVSWSTEWPWNMWTEVITTGGQFALYAPGLPGNYCQQINLRLLLDANAPQGMTLSNHVVVATPGDAQPDNNERLNQDANVSGPRYDLHLDKNMHSGVLVPGGWVNYFLWYNNQGNTTTHVWITDTIPAGLTFDYAHWGGGQPGENEPLPDPTIDGDQIVWDLGELPVSGSRWFHVQMNIADTLDAGDVITNCATIGSDGAESTPADNESCYSVILNDPGPNLRVTKEHWWNGDGQLGYRIHFYNLGDTTVADVWITDTLPVNTAWDGWWNLNFDQSRLVEESLNSDVLAWHFSELNPGDDGNIEFNANLDAPGAPLRWYTNTVDIAPLAGDVAPDDNSYEDVAFSGGEVRRAEMWLGTDHADMWGEGVPGPVTITTAYTQVVVWGDPGCNGCWNTGDIGPIWPGDTVIVEAGNGEQPVTILVPEPFDVTVDSATDTVSGQIAGANNQQVQIEGYWPDGHRDIQTNATGEYNVTYPDVPRGAQGHVRYQTTIDYADVMFHRRFQTPDLLLRVIYTNDNTHGFYEAGHTVWLTVTDSGGAVKGTAVVSTGVLPWGTGFQVEQDDWSPARPGIVPEDRVYGVVDNGNVASVRIGAISGAIDIAGDAITGTIYAPWFTQTLFVECHSWGLPGPEIMKSDSVLPDGMDVYSCSWDPDAEWDILPGQDVGVAYVGSDDNWVAAVFRQPYVRLTVDYAHDYVDVNTIPNAVVTLTVVGDAGVATLIAPADGDGYLHSTDQWAPAQPEIRPGDAVTATAVGLMATVNPVGTINGVVDVNADTVSGTIDVSWFTEELQVNCEIHEENAPGIQIENVDPDGGAFFCDFSGLWDIQPGHNIAVNYTEPDGDRVQTHPANPAPHMRVEKWLDGGNPGEGGNAIFRVQYRNEGDADAENVVITDTLQGMTFIADTSGFAHTGSGDQVVLDLGTVEPGDWIHFYVFAEITAAAGERVTNTVQIATSNPYDQGDPWEKWHEWSGDVQPDKTDLNTGKWAWTGDPAAGYDVVFAVNTCNNGPVASSEVVLTDTLHPSLTLQTWWGQHPGWIEVSFSDHELVVSRPTIAGGCSEVYVRATVDAMAEPGMPISNTATIYAANDLSEGDDEAWWGGNVNTPHTNLSLNKNWGSGQLVPGGELRYWIGVHNNGNIPVGTFRITDTLPVSTTFNAAWHWDQYNRPTAFPPIVIGDGYVVWEFAGLDNGFNDNFEVVLDVDRNALPGTVLVNTAEVTSLPGEDVYDDNISVWTETLFDHGPNLRVRKDGQWDDWGENTRRASYWFNVENVGDVTVDMVTVTDTYPAGMWLDGGIGGGFWRWWDWRDNGDHFTMTLELLEPGWSVGFNFGLITDTQPLPFGLIFTNTAEIMLVGNDSNPADNMDIAVLSTGPDLYVRKTLVAGDLLPGELVTFSLVFGNDRYGHEGWWNMQGDVRLTDVLPAGLEYVSAKLHWCGGTEWCDRPPDVQVGSTNLWLLAPLNAGEWNEIYLTVRIPNTATGLDTFPNQASIASSQPNTDREPYYANNSDSYAIAIELPYFEVSKVYASSHVAGMPITYTLTVTNTGNSLGTGIILSDTIPQGLENVGGGTLILPWMWWYIDGLAPNGGVATETFEATLPCVVSTVVNDDYRVVGSDQGVSSAVGAPVSVDVLAPTLNVGFDQSATTALVSTTLHFTDTSTTNGPAIVAGAWDFGDGHSASGATATHTYTTDGVFTVRLTITDTCGYTATTTSVVTVTAPALVASFDQSMNSAVVGTTLYFTDTSTTNAPPIAAWAWDFGDESTPIFTQNADHAYTRAGTFTVTLTVTDTFGYADTATGVVTITAPTLVASFDQSAVSAVVSATLYFTDTSTTNVPPIVAWAWDFGDESAPVFTQNADHAYTHGGVFTVTLTVTDTFGYADTATGVVTIAAPTIVASFDQSAVSAIAGTTLYFTDTSTTNAPPIVAWAWDFGDDSAPVFTQDAAHVYNRVGTFTVTLTVTDTFGYADTATGVVTITAPTIVASFDQSAVSAIAGTTLYFTDTSRTNGSPIVMWAWDFGDNGTSAAQNPTHQYNTAGEFTITLVVTDALGYNDVATSTLTVTPACIPLTAISFAYQPATILVNSLITFTATYSPANATSPISYDWSFGDGQAAVIVTTPVTHTYATIGEKTVQLTARNSCTPGGVTSQQIINVKSSAHSIFLPLVLRNY